jgi:hypothetical protein
MKDLAKQLVLVAQSIFRLNDSQRKTLVGQIITYIGVGVRDVSQRLAHEAKVGEVALLALDLLDAPLSWRSRHWRSRCRLGQHTLGT